METEELLRKPTAAAGAVTMRAVAHRRYGPPDSVLELEPVPLPVPGPGQVRVRVRAAGVSVGDHHVVTGRPYLIRLTPFGGIPRPRNLVPGTALAGVVESLGPGVTGLAPGDEVMGEATSGAFAELAVAAAARLAPRPASLSWEASAAVPWAMAALQGLRCGDALRPGVRVLVNGASGGVGTWAVQIARAAGAEVTAVCSGRNAELVQSLGAHHVVDYTREDFTGLGPTMDVVLDLVGNRPVGASLGVLRRGGVFVPCAAGDGDWLGPLGRLAWLAIRAPLARRRLASFVARTTTEDLLVLKALVDEGRARPVVEQVVPLEELPGALARVGSGHSRGQTVVRVG